MNRPSCMTGRYRASVLLAGLSVWPAMAAVVLDRTRLVFPASEPEVVVELLNDEDQPYLVQAWMDEGGADTSPEANRVPFVVLPPRQRVEGQRRAALRIRGLPGGLPVDRESVFWLNVLAIPGKTAGPRAEDVLDVAVATRIKVFWRPGQLSGNADRAAQSLRWHYEDGTGPRCRLHADNPSPYYVTVLAFALRGQAMQDHVQMIAPYASMVISIGCTQGGVPARYRTVDDAGAMREYPVGS